MAIAESGESVDSKTKFKRPWAGEGRLWLISILVFVLVISTFEAVVRLGWISDFFIPTPSSVAVELSILLQQGRFWIHILSTIQAIIFGFFLSFALALILGSLVGIFRAMELIVYPYVTLLQAVPKIALAPLVILWLGFGLSSKVVVAAAVAFFPIFVNVVEGVRTVDNRLLDYFFIQGATKWEGLVYLRIPNALPFLISGMRVGMAFAILGSIVAEFVGSTQGLGYFLIQQKSALNIPGAFAAIVVMMIFGLINHAVFSVLEDRLLYWSRARERN